MQQYITYVSGPAAFSLKGIFFGACHHLSALWNYAMTQRGVADSSMKSEKENCICMERPRTPKVPKPPVKGI
jgi:hypothetical protein